MQRIIIGILLFLIFIMAAFYYAYVLPFIEIRKVYHEELTRLEIQKDLGPFFKRILHPKSIEEQFLAFLHLRKRVWSAVADPNYHMAYSNILWRSDQKKRSVSMAAAALLILYTDKARCADKTAGQTKIFEAFRFLKTPLAEFKNLPQEGQQHVLDTALLVEQNISTRPANRAICFGMEAIGQGLKFEEEGKLNFANPSSGVHVIPDSPDIKVNYISDSQWLQKRNDIRKQFSEQIRRLP